MKVLFSYTLNMIRRNKNTSLSIMAAVLLSSTLLCAMGTYGYTQTRWQAEIEEYETGNWHGELGGEIPAGKLELVDNNLYVDCTMIKGPFTCLALPEESALPYLLLRDADKNYWDLMGEKNAIMEGRVPESPGEIAVSKSFFERNPQYSLGDTLTLPSGSREADGELLDETRVRKDGERFCRTGERQVTLVGIMDVTTNTAIPGYYAMGYMDRASLSEEDALVVYVKLKDIRRAYEIMPQIADTVGIEKDEYGNYRNHFRYHSRLLALNFVFPPGDSEMALDYLIGVLAYLLILLLAMGAFVMIINGAFQVSAMARIKQLGVFRSVGATPLQIALSVLMEAVLLSVLPVLLSIGIGYLFTVAVVRAYTEIAGDLLYFPITVRFSPLIALLCAILSFVTVLAAALSPALRIARFSPIEAIRMQEKANAGKRKWRKEEKKVRRSRGEEKGKESKAEKREKRSGGKERHTISCRLFGYTGELARASHRANRKSFRAGVMSLTFSLMLMTGFFVFMRMNDFLSDRNRNAEYYNILVRLDVAEETDGELTEELLSLPQEQEGTYYCVTRMALWVDPSKETEEFRQQGGFEGLNLNKWAIAERDGTYRIRVYLFGMREEHFDAYCRQLGEDPAKYYDKEKRRAVAVSMAPLYPNVVNNTVKEEFSYAHLKLSPGEKLVLEEKTEDSMETDCVLPVEVGAVAMEGPEIGDVRNNYTINLYMPLSAYYSAVETLSEEKVENYYNYVRVKTAPEDDLAVSDKIEELCGSVIASEDFFLLSAAREKRDNQVSMRAMTMVANCIGILLALIGISNTLSAVYHTMMRRRREFAMLRSVGLDDQGIKRLIFQEGIRMALTPVLTALGVIWVLVQMLMCLVDVSWAEFLPWMPWGEIFLSVAAIVISVAASYLAVTGRIRRDTIIEAVRDENV